MPRTREDLERAATEAESWLDSLNPDDPTVVVDTVDDLRRIGQALRRVAGAETDLADAVVDARAAGRSWSEIGMVLGVSRQAARQRYDQPAHH